MADRRLCQVQQVGRLRDAAGAGDRRHHAQMPDVDVHDNGFIHPMKIMSFIIYALARRLLRMTFTPLWQTIRRNRQQPAFAAGVCAVLALAVGANTALFTLVDAILLRPLPLADPDRLITFTIVRPGTDRQPLSLLDLDDFKQSTHTLGGDCLVLRMEREPHRPRRRRAAHRDARVAGLFRHHRCAGRAWARDPTG